MQQHKSECLYCIDWFIKVAGTSTLAKAIVARALDAGARKLGTIRAKNKTSTDQIWMVRNYTVRSDLTAPDSSVDIYFILTQSTRKFITLSLFFFK